MDSEFITWIFLVGGLLFMAAEILLPGGVSLVLGFSGLMIAVMRWTGLIEDPFLSLFVWMMMSVVLVLIARPLIKKYMPGDASTKIADEDLEAMDQIAEVVEPLSSDDNEGRIRFRGISWQARSLNDAVPVGAKVRIKYRENTTWIVEAFDWPDNYLNESESKSILPPKS